MSRTMGGRRTGDAECASACADTVWTPFPSELPEFYRSTSEGWNEGVPDVQYVHWISHREVQLLDVALV